MERRHLLALSGGLLAASLSGCVGDEANSTEPGDGTTGTTDSGDDNTDNTDTEDTTDTESAGTDPDIDDEQLATLVGETNGFAFDLYGELLAENPEENLFSSPVSIALALAMTYAGAREETREQMRDVLRYELDDEAVHEAFEQLQQDLDARADIDTEETSTGYAEDDDPVPFELSVANSVWGQEDYPFEQAYLDLLEDHYGGGLREVDYQSDPDGAREQINTWVADETEDRIDELLPEGSIDGLTRLVLANAVYFLANWKHTFPEEATTDQPFTALDGSEHEVPMMGKQRFWQYAHIDGTQAVDLPYVGDEVSMLVILPPEGEFESYEQSFDGETLTELVEALSGREGRVSLPRFEFDGGFQLSSALQSLGMTDAFDAQTANFSGIADVDEDFYIKDVYHDTFVAVDETGTEAAAATGVVMGTTTAPMDPFEFVADRPFLFAIRDRPTGAVLFFGRAIDPAGWC